MLTENTHQLEAFYKEQLESQRGMLSSAIEALAEKNKQLEKALTKVQNRNHELDSICYRTYHDMKEPMVTLLNLVDLLRMEFQGESADYLLNQVAYLVNRLDNFSHSLTDYVNVIQKEFVNSEIKTKEFFEELESSIQRFPGIDGVEVNFCNESISKSPVLYYDKDKLLIILKNIIYNSVRFKDINKSIQKVDVLIKVKNKNTIIQVIDNGMGISKSALSKVTNMFYKGSEKSTGSGLGLYIVHTLLKETNGLLRITSDESVGTTVTIVLPTYQ